MKALICTKPGTFEYKETTKPVLQEGHAILKVKRIGICGTDIHAYGGTQPFFTYPRILGHEVAAELVDADGAEGFHTGEALTFIPYFSCNKCFACVSGLPNCCSSINVFGVHIDGGMAEYISVPSYTLMKNQGLNFDQLSLVEPLAIAAHGIRRAGAIKDQFVLVVGAGPIGVATMEFARIAGAKVIAMDISATKLEFCKKVLHIPWGLNAADDNIPASLYEITGGDMPAVVIDATGSRQAINKGFQYMSHGGRYVLIGLQRDEIQFSHPEFHKREATLMSSRNATRTDFDFVINSIANHLINPSVYITHRICFTDLKKDFDNLIHPSSGVIKAAVEFN